MTPVRAAFPNLLLDDRGHVVAGGGVDGDVAGQHVGVSGDDAVDGVVHGAVVAGGPLGLEHGAVDAGFGEIAATMAWASAPPPRSRV